MNRYCVTISPKGDALTQMQIEVDAHNMSSAFIMANTIFGGSFYVADIRAWKPQRYRPVTIWVRLRELFGGTV